MGSEWRHIFAAPGVLATYSLRFTDSLVRMLFIPILPLFALELIAEATGVNSFTGLVIGSAAAAAAVFAVVFGRLGDRIGHRWIVITCFSALLARYTVCGEEGAVYGLDNSINAGARALAPMIGVSVAIWLGLRAVFSAAALLYLMAALLALRGLPHAVARCKPDVTSR